MKEVSYSADMQICRRRSLLAITWCVALGVFGAAQEHSQHAWDYGNAHGPSHWGDLNPEFVLSKSGHHQSPIDIRNPHQVDLPSIGFDYNWRPKSGAAMAQIFMAGEADCIRDSVWM